MFALIDAPRGAAVLDYGCGTGAFALPLAERRPDLRVIALDVQPAMLALLRAKPAFARLSNLETTERADGAQAGRIAVVFAINALHELGDADLATIWELLAHDGRFVSIDWNAAVDRPVGPPAARVYAVDEARERLERAGFAVVDARTLRYHHALTAVRS